MQKSKVREQSTQIQPAVKSKWGTLLILALAELLGMGVWFSASAVVPALTLEWSLQETGRAWLTMSVQIGFVAGALGSAAFNLADRFPARLLFAASALAAAMATAAIPALAGGLAPALFLRFLTGLFLAGVYPVGMKIMATWTKEDRGLGIGLLVGALTLGSAAPHLLNAYDSSALGGEADWRRVLYLAAGLAAVGGLLALAAVREGPYHSTPARFSWRYARRILSDRNIFRANLGYLGHMWELYAMWAWIPAFFLASYQRQGIGAEWASLAAFAIIGAGGLGSLAAGKLADQFGRTTVTIASMAVSGASAVTIGLLFEANPLWPTLLGLVWGFSVVADSAQFSSCVSELCPPQYTGTALTLQTSLGFLLTLVTIWMIPPMVRLLGWRWAFSVLAVGPAVGIWAMIKLRRSPAAAKLAGGRG